MVVKKALGPEPHRVVDDTVIVLARFLFSFGYQAPKGCQSLCKKTATLLAPSFYT